MTTKRRSAITGLWSIFLLALVTVLQSLVANAESPFAENKRTVLPSEAATTILKWYAADDSWITSEWVVTSENLDLLERALALELKRADFRQSSFKTHVFYRQYMPAQWNGLHLIVVNGFYASASDMFPDKDIDPDKWKHELLTAFGGGCGFWRAIYIVEQNKFMVLHSLSHHATVICNAPK
jgi:hypothetical protein